ncbi:DNA-binding transcription factor yap1 [Coemansia sp. RSA 485]|nr:DNA-binding transcription factor yap1 [Coemansia sp. RSA 485]
MSSVDIEHYDQSEDHGHVPQKRHNSTDLSDDAQQGDKKRAGRKPITTEASSKRTAQNRAAQRAFRERKQQHLKGLEEKIQELTERQERTERENRQLRNSIDRLKKENISLKAGKFTYEESPAEFDKAINDLFESHTSIPGVDLSAPYDLQQAAVNGADLTKPGAMDAIGGQLEQQQQQQQRQTQMQSQTSNDSPQNVPIMYPNLDLTSATTGVLASSLIQHASSGATPPALVGQDTFLSTTSSNLANGFSNDILNGIQLLASNQNLSSGSFVNDLFNSPGTTSSSIVPVSPTAFSSGKHTPGMMSNAPFTTSASRTQSTQISNASATTPGDMFVPLNNVGMAQGGVPPEFLNMDAFKPQNGSDFVNFASLLQQQQSDSPMSSQTMRTPSLSELLSLSPGQYADSLINFVPSSTIAAAATATTASPVINGSNNNGMGMINPALMQNNAAAYQAQFANVSAAGAGVSLVGDGSQFMAGSGRSASPVLPPGLMAYRNPDPVMAADDGDQLEKLLLNSMYTLKPTNGNSSVLDSLVADLTGASSSMNPASMLTSAPMVSSPGKGSSSSSSNSTEHTAVHHDAMDAQPSSSNNSDKQCTCRSCDDSPCEPCPVHGSPGAISKELRDIAPQVLEYVCTETNVLADDELNDLCHLMYKHAKCTEVQKRVEMVRNKLKLESDQEMIKAKKEIVQQLGLK